MSNDMHQDRDRTSSGAFIAALDRLTRHPMFGIVSLIATGAALFTEELPLSFRLGLVSAGGVALIWTALPSLKNRLRKLTTLAFRGSIPGFAYGVLVAMLLGINWLSGGALEAFSGSSLLNYVLFAGMGLGLWFALLLALAWLLEAAVSPSTNSR